MGYAVSCRPGQAAAPPVGPSPAARGTAPSPRIGAALLGHLEIQTTRGYVAVFEEDVVRHYPEFLDRRRAQRPAEEYRKPTEDEWAGFEEHFDKRRVEFGSCGRPYGTSRRHEPSCFSELTGRAHSASVERTRAPDDRSIGQIVLIYQLGVIRVDFSIEQFPVEGVHRRGGWCVSGQDRGHRRSHVAGIWPAAQWSTHSLRARGPPLVGIGITPG
ncbi:hypothetical protein [Nocardia sp. bgisy134]|uniref:hypothetical protein n=1 Tax=unclassified Nocardia TaxID=2637762 RepID=UPI003D73FE96